MLFRMVAMLALVFGITTSGVQAAGLYAVMAASLSADGVVGKDGVGTAIGSNKRLAIKSAKSKCRKKNGELCGYYIWTKAEYNSIIIKCHVPFGTLEKDGNVLGSAFDKVSLSKARKKAYKKVSVFLQEYGYRANKSNCRDLSSYSKKKFKFYK